MRAPNMKAPLILVPAYGRKYYSSEEAVADWKAGKDFKIDGGPYTSIRDYHGLQRAYGVVAIHYAKGTYVSVSEEGERYA